MRTINRLIISPRAITKQIRLEQSQAAELMRIPDKLEIQTEYLHMPGLLDMLEIEDDKDISKHSIKAVVARPGYFNIHVVLSEADWEKLGIRKTLMGQSQEIDGQVITYGRWDEDMRYQRSHKYKEKFINSKAEQVSISDYTEHAIGAWHELDHGVRRFLSIDGPTTHYHFYGYAAKYMTATRKLLRADPPRRYVRNPDPLYGWRLLPFHMLNLNAVQQKHIKSTTLLGLLKQLVNIFGLMRIKEEEELIDRLQPAVQSKVEALVMAMTKKGIAIDITSGYRGEEAQNKLYAQGRTTPGNIVTNAKFGDSLHNYGVAFDVAFLVNGKPSWSNKHDWQELGEVGEALGLEWGGRWTSFVDRPHFQYTGGNSLADFKAGRVTNLK